MNTLVKQTVSAILCATALTAVSAHAQSPGSHAPIELNIPAQSLEDSLLELARQASVQLVISSGSITQRNAPSINGTLRLNDALDRLLRDTDLGYKWTGERTLMIAPKGAGMQTISATSKDQRSSKRLAQAEEEKPSVPDSRLEEVTLSSKSIPEVLVEGARTLNVDIRRSEDDPMPYVVVEREEIARSGATTVEDFFKSRLSMNTQQLSNAQLPTAVNGATGTINLRGLYGGQTLILVDGRRLARNAIGGDPGQPDVNAIPLSAIERIEVLPTSAAAIYGGDATGGVVNIVLRRDYVGVETKLTYANTFESDAGSWQADISAGYAFNQGRTTVLAAGSFADSDHLTWGERDIAQTAMARIWERAPSMLADSYFPPSGARVNIRTQDGSPLFGPGTPAFASVPRGYVASEGLAPLIEAAGTLDVDLPDYAAYPGKRNSIRYAPRRESFNATLRHAFNADLEVFLETMISNSTSEVLSGGGGWADLYAEDPGNPFGKPVFVTFPVSSAGTNTVRNYQRRVAAGVIRKLDGDWSVAADVTWNLSRAAYTQGAPSLSALSGAIRSGEVNVFRDFSVDPLDVSAYESPSGRWDDPLRLTTWGATVRASGPVATLPAGPVVVSAMIDGRWEDIDDAISYYSFEPMLYYSKKKVRSYSAYAESIIPLVSEVQGLSWVRSLDAQVSMRYERNELTGGNFFEYFPLPEVIPSDVSRNDSVNPLIALKYEPVRGLALRVSFSTGLVNPYLTSLASSVNTFDVPIVDPRRGNTATVLPAGAYISGGNSNVKPERSKSYSAGFILQPGALSGLRLSIDYLKIRKTDNFLTFSPSSLLENEDLFPGRVTRGPKLAADPEHWAGPITSLDTRTVNALRAELEAIDLNLSYDVLSQKYGSFNFWANGTRNLHYLVQNAPDQSYVEYVGDGFSRPLKLKGTLGLNWQGGAWSAGWTGNYLHSYRATRNPVAILVQGRNGYVPSRITHDVYVGYRIPDMGMDIQLTARNLTNAEPRFDIGGLVNYYAVADDPAGGTYSLSVRKSF